ncbi:MAG: DUF3047 domain-containing protein [Rhodospirillales bacterium]|nr:DUF3047 domain-containing protein [Rhodospirillales bacterium]
MTLLSPLSAGIATLALLATACTTPTATTSITLSGKMDVLGPIPALEPNPIPRDWITQGTPTPGQLTVVERDGVPALKVINGANSIITVKPALASLLATPYLSWAWNMEPQDQGPHPVRLVVGFLGGNPNAPNGTTLPLHDRALSMIWGVSALQRGSINLPQSTNSQQAAARYIARGGQENTGVWWFETVDLSDIYRRTWPNDDIGEVQITFIGVAAAPGKTPTKGYVSGLRLSR